MRLFIFKNSQPTEIRMKKSSQKLRLLLAGAVLLAVTWLGYWIGYASSQRNHEKTLAEIQGQAIKDGQRYEQGPRIPAPGHGKKVGQDMMKVEESEDGHVYVVGKGGKRNEAINNVHEVDSRMHVQGIHQGHANKISQHINAKLHIQDTMPDINHDRNAQLIPPSDTAVNKIVSTIQNEARQDALYHEKQEKLQRQATLMPRTAVRNYNNPNLIPQTITRNNPMGEIRVAKFGTEVPLAERLVQGKNNPLEEIGIHDKPPSTQGPKAHYVDNIDGKPQPMPKFDSGGDYYALIHSGAAAKVHGQIHAKLKVLPDHVQKEAYIFTSNSLPKLRERPSIGNGHVATVAHGSWVFMNGLYNGYRNESHRAEIPSTLSFNITGTEPSSNYSREYKLDVAEGIYSEILTSKNYTLTHRMYAHRNITRLLVVEIDLVRKEIATQLKLKVDLNKWKPSIDLTFFIDSSDIPEVSYKHGRINAAEVDEMNMTQVHLYYDHVPDELVAPPGAPRTKWVFLTSIAPTREEALVAYRLGSNLVKANDELYAEHVRTWSEIWSRGRIDIINNLKLAHAVHGSMYYILSSLPTREDKTWPFYGLSPSGLPFGEQEKDYQGHIFWDQEVWVYPTVLLFHPDLAKLVLQTRTRVMKTARANAKINGHKGLQFPWESAATGKDVCSDQVLRKQGVHVSGDISLAILQYLYATNDSAMLKQGFLDLLIDVADFWVSMTTSNAETRMYEIKGVMGPDEHHPNVKNSVYTNAVAQVALSAPEYAFKLLNKTVQRYKVFADDMYIPYDHTLYYHPEFDGYTKGTKVKQADAILLGYPLLRPMAPEARRNDLNTYESVTEITGPAMSWNMFTIGWLELKDRVKADNLLAKNYAYIQNEFQVWHETSYGKGATNFITGMGGFLQSIVFGYGGFRIRQDRLDFDPTLTPKTTELHFIGIDYLGCTMDFYISSEGVLLTLTHMSSTATPLKLFVYSTEEIISLREGGSQRLKLAKTAILPAHADLPEEV